MDSSTTLWMKALLATSEQAERAARALKHVAEADPKALYPQRRKLFSLARQTKQLRVRWNLIVILGLLPLRGAERDAVLDWLFECLANESPFTRTFALQSLVSLAAGDPALGKRLRPVAERFAAEGTASMRARARKLLPPLGALPHTTRESESRNGTQPDDQGR